MEPQYPEPKFLPRLLNVTAREGGKAVLPCAVHYLGTKEVRILLGVAIQIFLEVMIVLHA